MKGKSKSQTAGWIEAIKGLNGQDSCPVPIVASPDPRDATIRELDHWKQVSGFDTPEQMVAAVNDRFDKELPRGLAKSLWQLTQRDCIKYERIIRELRALCGEAAVQLDEYLDYERAEHICIVIGDVALAAKLRAASAAQALADPGGKP
jgi:hypothetical protein